MAVSVEESQRRSELAKAMHRELHPDGSGRPKFGGKQGGGRPKRKRLTEVVNERIVEHAEDVAEAIIACLDRNQMPHIRLQAARLASDIGLKEAELQAREDRSFDGMSNGDIIEFVLGATMRGLSTGTITPRPDDIVVQ